MTPNDRKYTKTHEWVKIEGSTAVVGITDHAQRAMGDITFVECPPVGKEVSRGNACAVVESVKAASDIYAPLSGRVAAVNKELETNPELINKDPYGKGWIYKLENFATADLAKLLTADQYEASLK
ncbi:MAG: glycine cleavage system protein GcvH [Kiritimatiellae bacterium]|nr:glycine cleavage system protein GcvH [Kiritimatiellia bacterium]